MTWDCIFITEDSDWAYKDLLDFLKSTGFPQSLLFLFNSLTTTQITFKSLLIPFILQQSKLNINMTTALIILQFILLLIVIRVLVSLFDNSNRDQD